MAPGIAEALLLLVGICLVFGAGAFVADRGRAPADLHEDDWCGEYWGAHRW